MSEIILSTKVVQDFYTEEVERLFGLKEEVSKTVIQNNIELPPTWNIGIIWGPNGSGKSSLLRTFGTIQSFTWDDNKAVISNFPSKTPEEVYEAFCGAGFSSVPAWLRPYKNLSEGEQLRADLAARFLLASENQTILIDEFTSKNDRVVAKSIAYAATKYLRKKNRRAVFATCHFDILEWGSPNWYYNPAEGVTRTKSDSLQRPKISLEIIRCSQTAWELFKHHHYLDTNLSKGARCFLALWDGIPVGFSAALMLPHATIGLAWRESRTVVLPDYQGLNIGVKLSDYIASLAKATGCRFYSKTVHPAMVAYRKRSENWRETEGSGKLKLTGHQSMIDRNWKPTNRRCYSFEYIGPASSDDEAKVFWDDSEYCQRKKKKAISRGLIHKGQGKY